MTILSSSSLSSSIGGLENGEAFLTIVSAWLSRSSWLLDWYKLTLRSLPRPSILICTNTTPCCLDCLAKGGYCLNLAISWDNNKPY